MIEEQATNNRHAPMKLSAILRSSFGVVFLVAIIACLIFLPTPHYLKWFLEWIHNWALGGSPFYCLLRDRLFVFSAWIHPDFGGRIHVWNDLGTVTSSSGATLGAMAAFLIAV